MCANITNLVFFSFWFFYFFLQNVIQIYKKSKTNNKKKAKRMSSATLFKVHKNWIKKDPNVVFFISRSCDDKVCVYKGIRLGNKLLNDMIVPHFCHLETLSKMETVAASLVKNFFGARTTITQDGYKCVVQALPQREMTIKLENAKVVSSALLNFSTEIDGQLVTLDVVANMFALHMNLTFNSIGIPDLKDITIHGTMPFSNLEKSKNIWRKSMHLQEKIVDEKDNRKVFVTETIVVTDKMKSKFDVLSLFKDFIAETAK